MTPWALAHGIPQEVRSGMKPRALAHGMKPLALAYMDLKTYATEITKYDHEVIAVNDDEHLSTEYFV